MLLQFMIELRVVSDIGPKVTCVHTELISHFRTRKHIYIKTKALKDIIKDQGTQYLSPFEFSIASLELQGQTHIQQSASTTSNPYSRIRRLASCSPALI